MFFFVDLYSQRRGNFNVSVTPGAMFYQGDLSGDINSNFKTTHFSIGADFGYRLNNFFNFSFGYTYGKLSGADSLVAGKEKRNFHFYTNIHDFHLLSFTDLNALRRKIWPKKTVGRGDWAPSFSGPELIFGVGYFNFNPKAEKDGVEYQLNKLGTEGQRLSSGAYPDAYNLWQFSIKYGLGFGYNLSRQLNLSMTLLYTITFTDYLDDVSGTYPDYQQLMKNPDGETVAYFTYGGRDGSQVKAGSSRGNPDKNDGYVMLGFKLTYTFGRSEFGRIMNL
jgi:hypothetical protein